MSLIKRIRNWYVRRYVMCRCRIPEYEVTDGTLKCAICHKPAPWEQSQR